MENVRLKSRVCLYLAVLTVLSSSLLLGCQSTSHKVPSISAKKGEAFVWHDLLSPNVSQSRQFMNKVLGWQASSGGAYKTLHGKSGQVIGGVFDTQAMNWSLESGGWLLSLGTPNLDETLERIRQQGGQILQGVQYIPERGRSALVADPQGAVFNIVELSTDVHNAVPVDNETWIWHDLITAQPTVAAAWYASIFQLEVVDLNGGRKLLKKDNVEVATVSVNNFEDSKNQWLPVVGVNDFENTVVKVSQEGGRVALVLPSPAGNGKLALVQDPTGAALILQEQEVSP